MLGTCETESCRRGNIEARAETQADDVAADDDHVELDDATSDEGLGTSAMPLNLKKPSQLRQWSNRQKLALVETAMREKVYSIKWGVFGGRALAKSRSRR